MRRWKKDPVQRRLIERLVDAARWAPNTCNLQTWKFLVVFDEKVRRLIGRINRRGSLFLEDAPVIILVLTDKRPYFHIASKGFVWTPAREKVVLRSSSYDVGASIQNMLLVACTLGLGACWCFWGASEEDEREFRTMLSIPDNMIIHASIGLGYSDLEPTPPARRPLKEILVWDKFGSG